MKKLLIADLVLLGLTILFWDTAFGTLTVIALIFMVIATIGQMVMPQAPEQPELTLKELWVVGKNKLLAVGYVALILVMICNWPSAGSMMIFWYLVVRVICFVVVRLLIRGHSPLHVDYEPLQVSGPLRYFIPAGGLAGFMKKQVEAEHGSFSLDNEEGEV